MEPITISSEDVCNKLIVLDDVNKRTDLDRIHQIVLNTPANALSLVLSILFNLTLLKGVNPSHQLFVQSSRHVIMMMLKLRF